MSRGTNSRLPFGVNVHINLSIYEKSRDRGMWKDARKRRAGKERRKERAPTIALYRPENTTCL